MGAQSREMDEIGDGVTSGWNGSMASNKLIDSQFKMTVVGNNYENYLAIH